MRALVLLACAAAAAAAYIPIDYGYGHNQAYKNYFDDTSSKNSYNKGDYGQDASAYKDSSSGYLQGAQNLQHEDHYTSLKHNIDKDKKVIKHKADDHKSSANAYQYGNTDGGSYQSGGLQQHSDKGQDGKYVAHLGKNGAYGYGHGLDTYNAGQNNAYTNYGITSGGQYGAHYNLAAGSAAQGYDQKSFVDHDETIARENEDFAFKDVLHQKDLHADYQKAHSAGSNHGHSSSNFNQAKGLDTQHQLVQGYGASAAHGAGKGAHGQVHSGAHSAAGQSHQDHAASQGAQHLNYDNANSHLGSAYNVNGKERNAYHTKTRKVQKLEHEINHKDGKSQDAFWNDQHLQNHYGLQGSHNNGAYGATRDNTYNNYNAHQAFQYQPYFPFSHY